LPFLFAFFIRGSNCACDNTQANRALQASSSSVSNWLESGVPAYGVQHHRL
jgi:hypothetical protein